MAQNLVAQNLVAQNLAQSPSWAYNRRGSGSLPQARVLGKR